MATFPMSRCQDLKMLRMKEVTALKDAAENLNTRKSTINWVRVFENWFDENGLEKNLEMVHPEHLDKVLERFFAYVCKQVGSDHDCERNLSRITLYLYYSLSYHAMPRYARIDYTIYRPHNICIQAKTPKIFVCKLRADRLSTERFFLV